MTAYPPRNDNLGLFQVVKAWQEANYPGPPVEEIRLTLTDGRKVVLPMPTLLPTASAAQAFVPTAFQEAILEALDGKAMRTAALGAAVGDKGRLFKPGGLKELREQGMVAHHDRLGFYRPDAPPTELETPEQGTRT